LIAVLIALLVGAIGVAPQFATKVIGGQGGQGTNNGGAPGDSAGTINGSGQPGDPNSGGRAGHTVNGSPIPGSAGRTGSNAPGNGTNGAPGSVACAAGRNGGATAPGVTATEIHVASTIVTTGVGSGFLGEAADGMRAAINQANQAGGVCGRRITSIDGKQPIETINDNWDPPTGQADIQNWISSNQVFALVGEPDSEGLDAAIQSHTIDNAGIPVVGTDGMLSGQYYDPWVWPVATSTVTNMHIIAQYAVNTLHANSFGIVFDNHYKFGREGARAFAEELKRLGKGIEGYGNGDSCAGKTAYCGISAEAADYSTQVQNFNSACAPDRCDAVVMLLEPGPAENWASAEAKGSAHWAKTLFGGEPLFDDRVGHDCAECGNRHMEVWTGYRPAISPFDGESAVARYCQALKAYRAADDCHNEFTQGAYLGTLVFIEALKKVGAAGLPLTRENLKSALNNNCYDLGLSQKLCYGSTFPRVANTTMTAFSENYSNGFNGWNYDGQAGFRVDPHPASDMR